jgi:hypothetical protein
MEILNTLYCFTTGYQNIETKVMYNDTTLENDFIDDLNNRGEYILS